MEYRYTERIASGISAARRGQITLSIPVISIPASVHAPASIALLSVGAIVMFRLGILWWRLIPKM